MKSSVQENLCSLASLAPLYCAVMHLMRELIRICALPS